MRTKIVYNFSKCKSEAAELKTCPRCKGFGRNFGDEDLCHICNGTGEAWQTNSGWTLQKYERSHSGRYY